MHVEECWQAVLFHFLPRIDKKRKGVCIDVGVGTFAFFCELFARLGFKTVAVEPLPIDRLRNICHYHGIKLVESCLLHIDGFQTLYIGTYRGAENLNLSSLSPHWWGASTDTRRVKSMTLPTLLSTINARKVTCLKLDIEGAEARIIRQFLRMPESLLPRVVMFEYGGGDTIESGRAGWSQQFLAATMECLSVLKKCGYGFSVVIDSAPDTAERIFDLQSLDLEPNRIFPTCAIYGNIISFRDFRCPESGIAGICTAYHDNDSPPPVLRLPENHLPKFLRRLSGVFTRMIR